MGLDVLLGWLEAAVRVEGHAAPRSLRLVARSLHNRFGFRPSTRKTAAHSIRFRQATPCSPRSVFELAGYLGVRVRVWTGAAVLAPVERGDLLHVCGLELEVEDFEV